MKKPVTQHLPSPDPAPLYVDRLYARYFQKSRSFLYPLLGISRHVLYNPIQVYSA